jgi:hypothetical protein
VTDILQVCITPNEHCAVVTEETRQPVIDCLRASWGTWDYFERCLSKHVIGGYVDNTTKTMHEALEKMTNEQLALFLYDVWFNGMLHITSDTKQ